MYSVTIDSDFYDVPNTKSKTYKARRHLLLAKMPLSDDLLEDISDLIPYNPMTGFIHKSFDFGRFEYEDIYGKKCIVNSVIPVDSLQDNDIPYGYRLPQTLVKFIKEIKYEKKYRSWGLVIMIKNPYFKREAEIYKKKKSVKKDNKPNKMFQKRQKQHFKMISHKRNNNTSKYKHR